MADAPRDPRRPPRLIDFVAGYEPTRGLDLEVAIKEDGRVVLFHSLPFTREVSWFEFDVRARRLEFIMDEGQVREIGKPLSPDVAEHVARSHQILMVLMDPVTREPKEGFYVPLVIQRL